MKFIRYIILLIALGVVVSCNRNEEPVERPLYPTEGAINARFSVNDSVTVVFAKGNLQYQASTNTWRFASNQYDIIGLSNENIDTLYSGWIDLFGWGTSGYNESMPYTANDSCQYYGFVNRDISGSDYDWGQFNAISNAGNKKGLWRTLSYNEWTYLFSFRPSAGVKRGLATIQDVGADGKGMSGLVILPDKWELPSGCAFQYGSAEGYATNTYSVPEWNRMQAAGAVFLPAGGYRDIKKVSLVGEYGCYWTSTYYDHLSARELYMYHTGYDLSTAARSNGHSVRLVQDN